MELCENFAEASNKVSTFKTINVMGEDMANPKSAALCNFTDSEIANTEHDESTENTQLSSCTISKAFVEMADKEVPMWSSDEFNLVQVFVKNGAVCVSTYIIPQ